MLDEDRNRLTNLFYLEKHPGIPKYQMPYVSILFGKYAPFCFLPQRKYFNCNR
jgi:hypothetical protein